MLQFCQFCVGNSAKATDSNKITPESNYVTVYNDSACVWYPRFDLAVTQCHVDVTWFPFDEQKCDLEFESWLLPKSVLKLNTNNESNSLKFFLKPDGWQLLRECSRIVVFRVNVTILKSGL